MTNTPGQLSESLLELSATYSKLSDELVEIMGRKPAQWNEIREKVNSDSRADRVFEGLPDGIRETSIKIQLKALEKRMSSIQTHLRIMSQEARNMF